VGGGSVCGGVGGEGGGDTLRHLSVACWTVGSTSVSCEATASCSFWELCRLLGDLAAVTTASHSFRYDRQLLHIVLLLCE